MAYRAIGFDWGGVLNGQPGRLFGESAAKLLGVTHEEYKEAYFRHNQKVNRGEITRSELWTLVLSELGRTDDTQAIERITKLDIAANEDSLNPEMINLVIILRENGYKVGLLSNNIAGNAVLIHKKLDKYFDVLDISVETGLVKPEPDAFRHLATGLGVDASELIFIDDTPESLSTASEVGYTPILFSSYSHLVKELERLGITI